MPKNDPYPNVFDDYVACSIFLDDAENIEQGLRFFELDLMEHIGYGLQLTRTLIDDKFVRPKSRYLLDEESGISENIKGYVEGATLLALEARSRLDKKALYQAKQLTRRMIDFHLQGGKLKSRAVLANIIKQL